MQQSIINLIVCYCGYDIRVTDTIDFARRCRSVCVCVCAFYLQILLAFLIDSIKYIDNKRRQHTQHQPIEGTSEWAEAELLKIVFYSLETPSRTNDICAIQSTAKRLFSFNCVGYWFAFWLVCVCVCNWMRISLRFCVTTIPPWFYATNNRQQLLHSGNRMISFQIIWHEKNKNK